MRRSRASRRDAGTRPRLASCLRGTAPGCAPPCGGARAGTSARYPGWSPTRLSRGPPRPAAACGRGRAARTWPGPSRWAWCPAPPRGRLARLPSPPRRRARCRRGPRGRARRRG
eukprot:gene4789-biopygen11548